MGISQLIVATLYVMYKISWASHRDAGWATAVWTYVCNFAFSIGLVNWVIHSEIFPPDVRPQAVGIAIGINWLCNVRSILNDENSRAHFYCYSSSSHSSLHGC